MHINVKELHLQLQSLIEHCGARIANSIYAKGLFNTGSEIKTVVCIEIV